MLTIYTRSRLLPPAILIDRVADRYTLVCAACHLTGPSVLLTDPTPVRQLAEDFRRGHTCRRR